MDEPFGENEDLPLLNRFGVEDVGGGDETHIELSLEHEDDLGGAWVGVRRVEAAGRVVDTREGNAEGVEAGDFLDVGAGDEGSGGVVGGAGFS